MAVLSRTRSPNWNRANAAANASKVRMKTAMRKRRAHIGGGVRGSPPARQGRLPGPDAGAKTGWTGRGDGQDATGQCRRVAAAALADGRDLRGRGADLPLADRLSLPGRNRAR